MADIGAKHIDLRKLGRWEAEREVRVEIDGRVYVQKVFLRTAPSLGVATSAGQEAYGRFLQRAEEPAVRRVYDETLHGLASEQLVDLALEAERTEIADRAGLGWTAPAEPARSAGEDEAKFRSRREKWERGLAKAEEAQGKAVDSAVMARREELRGLARPELEALAFPSFVRSLALDAFMGERQMQILAACCFEAEDHEKPYFGDAEEVRALHPAAREAFWEAYCEVDAGQQEAQVPLADASESVPSSS